MDYSIIKYRRNHAGALISRTIGQTSSGSEARKQYRQAIGQLVRATKLTPLTGIGLASGSGVALSLGGTVLESWGEIDG